MAPHVFGTKAVSLKSTPMDSKYPRLEFPSITKSFGSLRELNSWVNRQISWKRDPKDIWQTAEATWLLKTGDCEDFALLKEALILKNGLADEDQLFLTVGRDLVYRSEHAMLVVASGGQFLVLDNVHSRILPDTAYPDFKPVASFSRRGRWIHGKAV